MFKISIFVVLVFVAVVNAFKPFPLKKLVAGVIVAGVTFSPALADQVFEKRAKYEIGAGVHRTIDDTDIQIQRKKEKVKDNDALNFHFS